MFALLALMGDMGCGGGPTVVGFVTENAGGRMQNGILAAVIFPAVMIVCLLIQGRKAKKNG